MVPTEDSLLYGKPSASLLNVAVSLTTKHEEDMLERFSNLEELVKEASRLANLGSNILKDCREISDSIVAASEMKKGEISKAAYHQMFKEEIAFQVWIYLSHHQVL